jgi:undecaprenyl diphosphate synthase
MIYWLYEKMLLRQIHILPEHICFMLTGQDVADAPEKILEVTRWCRDLSERGPDRGRKGSNVRDQDQGGIRGLTYHISTPDPDTLKEYLPHIRMIARIARLTLHCGPHEETTGEGMDVTVAIGKSGREEIASCIREMARQGVPPEEVDEALIESHLTFKHTPDFVIKTGGDHLTDFLIWQSVYSELFFSDLNWKWMRRVDFLRALRDYQARVRRFGR